MKNVKPYPTDGRCARCGKNGTPLVRDHDHRTNEFRGWVHHDCNIRIAYVEGGDVAERALTESYLAGNPPPSSHPFDRFSCNALQARLNRAQENLPLFANMAAIEELHVAAQELRTDARFADWFLDHVYCGNYQAEAVAWRESAAAMAHQAIYWRQRCEALENLRGGDNGL